MRILVVGGTGFLGSRAVEALRRIPGAEVVPGSRSPRPSGVRIDLTDYVTRAAMNGFDVVVDCADLTAAAPERAAEFCLLRGMTFLETSADAAAVERLLDAARRVPDPRGSVVVAAGLFPGLSNLLAAKVCGEQRPSRLEVGVRYSPASRAGLGVCRLMASALSRPAARFECGERVLEPPVTVDGTMPFFGVERRVLGVGLPESLMLHWSRGVASTGSFVAPVPPLPLVLQRVASLFAPWELLRWRPVRGLAAASLGALRCGLMRWRTSAVEIAVLRDRQTSGTHGGGLGLRVRCGFAAAAYAIAASVAVLRERALAPGVHLIDEVTELDEVVERMHGLSGGEVSPALSREAPSSSP